MGSVKSTKSDYCDFLHFSWPRVCEKVQKVTSMIFFILILSKSLPLIENAPDRVPSCQCLITYKFTSQTNPWGWRLGWPLGVGWIWNSKILSKSFPLTKTAPDRDSTLKSGFDYLQNHVPNHPLWWPGGWSWGARVGWKLKNIFKIFISDAISPK